MYKCEYKGKVYTIKELSEMSGITEVSIRDRLRRGYSVEQAIRPTATKDSVEAFCKASWWEDWVGMSINELYEIYWLWCIQKNHNPTTKQGFSRHLFANYPWLKTVPTKSGNKYYRYIRKK